MYTAISPAKNVFISSLKSFCIAAMCFSELLSSTSVARSVSWRK